MTGFHVHRCGISALRNVHLIHQYSICVLPVPSHFILEIPKASYTDNGFLDINNNCCAYDCLSISVSYVKVFSKTEQSLSFVFNFFFNLILFKEWSNILS